MKLFAQSSVPTRIPYIHLGYLAATARRPQGGLLGSSLVMLVVGACLALKLAVGKTKGGYTAIHVRLRKGAGRVAAGIVLVVLAMAGAALAYANGKLVYRHAGMMTRVHQRSIEHAIEQRLEAGKLIPDDPQQLIDEGQDYRLEDGWFHPMRLDKTTSEGRTVYYVVSAGPDGEFGTDDDIRSEGVPRVPKQDEAQHPPPAPAP